MIGYDIYERFTKEHFPIRQRMTMTTKIYCSRLYMQDYLDYSIHLSFVKNGPIKTQFYTFVTMVSKKLDRIFPLVEIVWVIPLVIPAIIINKLNSSFQCASFSFKRNSQKNKKLLFLAPTPTNGVYGRNFPYA
jgi:hypothetical protein